MRGHLDNESCNDMQMMMASVIRLGKGIAMMMMMPDKIGQRYDDDDDDECD